MSAFTSEKDNSEGINCHYCNYEILIEETILRDDKLICHRCDYDSELIDQYSEEQQNAIIGYSMTYNLTIEEAIDYQTHCHCCGREEKDGLFSDIGHQYCRARCQDYIEDFRYKCYRDTECKVCYMWQPEEEQQEENEEETLDIYDFEGTGEQLRRLRANNPILADETADEYEIRIWSLAYKEDEEEEKKRFKVENDINTLLA